MPLGNFELQQEILNSQWKFRVPIGNLEFLLENYNSVRKLYIHALIFFKKENNLISYSVEVGKEVFILSYFCTTIKMYKVCGEV